MNTSTLTDLLVLKAQAATSRDAEVVYRTLAEASVEFRQVDPYRWVRRLDGHARMMLRTPSYLMAETKRAAISDAVACIERFHAETGVEANF